MGHSRGCFLRIQNILLRNPQLIVAQTTNLPTPEDLALNIEVQFTPEIIAKAQELGNNPVKIYNWVRNNVEFVPTYGSIQGAHKKKAPVRIVRRGLFLKEETSIYFSLLRFFSSVSPFSLWALLFPLS
jgi:hypothetical protein